jgi:hypothetical protein
MLWQEWSPRGLNAMGKLVADIIVETLQNAGVKHCYGVVGDTLNLIAWNDGQRHAVSDLHGRGGDVWEMVKENFL